jgi:ubiquinone/menaquinone biosynthesis C-methylase UbiE
MNRIRTLILCAALCACAGAQVAEKANRNYQTKEGREHVAANLADPHRDVDQKPAELVEAMQLKPGMTVADVGTGVGYMLPWLSKAVGPSGRVIGEDIHADFIDAAKEKAKSSVLTNVAFVLGGETDPKLPAGTVDAELLLEVYHHFDYPEKMLANLREALAPAGRLFIVDFYKRADAMPGGNALEHIRLDEDDVIREVEKNGFKLTSQHEHQPHRQYMAIFEKK